MAEEEPQSPETVEVQIPQINLPLSGTQINVVPNPSGDGKALVIGPILLNVILPLNNAGAQSIADDLTKVHVQVVPANVLAGMPKEPPR